MRADSDMKMATYESDEPRRNGQITQELNYLRDLVGQLEDVTSVLHKLVDPILMPAKTSPSMSEKESNDRDVTSGLAMELGTLRERVADLMLKNRNVIDRLDF